MLAAATVGARVGEEVEVRAGEVVREAVREAVGETVGRGKVGGAETAVTRISSPSATDLSAQAARKKAKTRRIIRQHIP
jgi:hypothetical protein